MSAFADANNRIAELVQRFQLNPPKSEAATRLEFIDPFFEALGWDVRNVAGNAEQYKDVVVEPSVIVGTATKAPDYSFRIGGVRKFFVEAKKPSVAIKGDPHPAYQLRRYAWSGKLPLSILTDFEEFAVYDCTKRPRPTDKASTGRILYCTFTEYAKKLRDIYDIFAKDAILKGSFDRYQPKRGTAEVDTEFLKEIEGWRNVLARNLAIRNRKLDIDQMNEAVQRVIDRIIFLRMAEDRGIEPQGRLLALINAPRIYKRFGTLCENADAKYNSGLFDFKADKWTLGLKIDDKVLKPIIQGIYYPASPYEFSVIPPEILGNVYEQFLGKVIRLTRSHQAKVEEKPEVKKAGGVYYTPKYIVDYIVEHTVGELIKEAGPDHEGTKTQRTHKGPTPNATQMNADFADSERSSSNSKRQTRNAKLKGRRPLPKDFHILDPACGSGSFLLGAYQYLLDHCLEWYVAHSPEKRKKEVYRVAARSTGVSGTGVSPVFNSGFKHGQACPERSRRDGRATQGNPPLRIRHGAYLPHWTREGATYFVTFRLADSLPQAVVDKWLEERQAVARKAEQANRPLTPAEQQRLQRLFCEKVDAYLDAAHGSCLLRDERAAKHVEDALLHFDGERYDLLAWSIMPNHVHLVCTPRPGHELPVILHAWKSFTAKQANRLLKRQGAFWQPEYYDHLIRDEKDLQRCMAYTYQNPDKAGLKNWDWRGIGISGTGISGTGASGTSGTGVPPVFNSGFKHGQDGRATSLASSFEWRLTTAERKRILTDHIYGVDIDRQAVEVTKLSLLLKVLEGESADTLGRQLQLFHERALPNLSNNIKCGNSLIGPDYFEGRLPGSIDPDELRRVNPFDWEAAFPHVLGNNVPKTRRGFDAVIGNPPYVKEYTNRQPFRDLLGTQLERYYQGKMDLWYIFASRAIDLLTPSGLHSFIATNNWPTSAGASKLRAKLVSETALTRFVDFGDYKVFSNAGIQTAVYVVAKVAPRAAYQQCRYSRLDNPRASEEPVRVALKHDIFDPPIGHTFDASVEVHEAGTPFTFVNAGTRRVIARMEGVPVFRLGVKDVAQGIVLPQEIVNERQLPRLRQCRARLGDGIFLLSTAEVKRIARTKAERQLIKPYFTTRQISRYFADSRTSVWMLYTTRELELAPNCRSVKRHLDRFQPVITSSNKPYGIHRPRDPYFHVGEKILALRKTSKPDFAYVTFPSYVTQTFNIIKPRSRSYDLRYLTGILNSKLAYFWFWHKGKRQGELLQIDKEPLMRFPLRTVDLRRDEDKAAHDRMVELVDRMLALHKQLHAAEGGTGIPARGQKKHGQDGRATSGTGVPPVFNSGFKHGQDGRATTSWDKELLQRQIDATDRQIDQLVYELYGLTDKEIRIIEQGMRP